MSSTDRHIPPAEYSVLALDQIASAPVHDAPEQREIGRIVGAEAGPTFICVAGLHGNERAGVTAAKRALEVLGRRSECVRGEFIAIAGNLGAMRLGVRFRHRDFNRVWTEARVAGVEDRARAKKALDEEDIEQLELLATIRAIVLRARGPVYLVDLHSTSAQGLPYIIFGDTLGQRKFVGNLPLPIVIGLEDQLDGSLSAYWTNQGLITCALEGGQHDDPSTTDNIEAVLLLGAETAGILGNARITEAVTAYNLLERRRGNLPRVMEVISRHAITKSDEFVMEPGFLNLARVRAGQLLARDRNGEIRAPKDGYVLMPLYQGQGSEGFFWGRECSPARLRISETLRKMKVDRFLRLLPGVKQDPDRATRLVVDPNLARLLPLDVFATLGYRRVRKTADVMTVERQSEQDPIY